MIAIAHPALPKGGGATRGLGETFQSQQSTGTACLAIPIPTSPCRGFEPHLSLDYSSGSGNGIFGIGFNIAIPNISRKTAKAVPRYDDTDSFILANSDDLVPVAGPVEAAAAGYVVSAYRPRTEGLYARIQKWVRSADGDTHWRVTTQDNITSIYGQSKDARIADPANKARIFQWLIETTYDAKGNRIAYEYQDDRSNKQIRRIKYGNYCADTSRESADWHFEVGFEYSTPAAAGSPGDEGPNDPARPRPDPFSSFKCGFEIRTSVRCIRISMSHRFEHEAGGQLFEVSSTRLDYEAASGLTFLAAVTHTGHGIGVIRSLPPLQFAWSAAPLGEAAASGQSPEFKPLALEAGRGIPGFLEPGTHQMVDLYGEGLPGILCSDADAVLFARPLGDGKYGPSAAPQSFPIDRNLQGGDHALMDLSGEGRLDLVVSSPSRAGYYEARGDGSWAPFRDFMSVPSELHHP
ncbi:MAG: SpvB/TcaC N-terminal domain-containing protein, partial [Hyphomicrobiaceae bacterium]